MKKVVFLLLCVCAAAPSLTAQSQRRTVRRVGEPIRNQYVVVLATTDDAQAVGLEAAQLNRGLLKDVFSNTLHGFVMRMTPAAAEALANDPRVAYVEEDGVVHATAREAPAPWGLDRIDQRALPLDGAYSYGSWVRQVHVHVLDTGIRTSHVDFGGRAFFAGDYVDDDGDGDPADVGNDDDIPGTPDGADCNGHGTHVAATIGGTRYGVAKHVTLWSHRVLDCSGTGAVSGVIAAVEAVTADSRRPAVVNLSLSGETSAALDDAIRKSIAAGVTYVVAAGNDGVDASQRSPADVKEAITVGATDESDTRADFSNFGAVLDVFAPGVSIPSASYADDTGTLVMSGTSMAAPHVTGVAALYLERTTGKTPADVQRAIVGRATPGVLSARGAGSPNRLLYANALPTPPKVSVVRPNGGETFVAGVPITIQWTASDGDGLSRIDVMASSDNGASYAEITGCQALPGAARSCVWASPGPVTAAARIAVFARDTYGDRASDASNGAFRIRSAAQVPPGTPGGGLPSPWLTTDVGSVGVAGRAAAASGTFTVEGGGADIWGAADGFRFVYRPLHGDGTVVAQVTSVEAVAPWSKAAVMIRSTLASDAANAAMVVSAGKGLSFQRRSARGGATQATPARGAAPAWVKLTRQGARVSAYRSSNGQQWSLVGSATIAMGTDVFAGVAVSSHAYGQLARAAFRSVDVQDGGTEVGVTGFLTLDVGSVGAAGGVRVDGEGAFTLSGAGADVWGSQDGLRYMYKPVDQDWDVEARVSAVNGVQPWSKAGLMVRETLDPGSPQAFLLVSAGRGVAFQYRRDAGGATAQAGIAAGSAPIWLKLSRRGTQISAHHRPAAGGEWQALGTVTLPMAARAYLGLAVTSHQVSRTASASFDNLMLAAAR